MPDQAPTGAWSDAKSALVCADGAWSDFKNTHGRVFFESDCKEAEENGKED